MSPIFSPDKRTERAPTFLAPKECAHSAAPTARGLARLASGKPHTEELPAPWPQLPQVVEKLTMVARSARTAFTKGVMGVVV